MCTIDPCRALAALAFVATLSTPAPAQGSGARDRAMGGVGVASSHYSTAGFTNPALLSHYGKRDDVGVVMPFFQAIGEDQDQLLDALDEFQDTLTRMQDLLDAMDFAGANALRPVLAAQLAGLDGRTAQTGLGAGLAVSLPSDGLALAVVARSYVDGQVFPVIDPADVTTINNSVDSGDFDNLLSEAVAIAAGIVEVGLTSSYRIDLLGRPLSIGVTPKIQRIETFNYAASVSTFDDDNAFDDITNSVYRQDETSVNVDAGVAFEPVPFLTIGLAGQDLVGTEVDTVLTNGRTFTYELGPRLVAGVAFRSSWFTVAADVDLIERKRFDPGTTNPADDTQTVRGGAEFDAFGWVKVRAGVEHDFEDTRADVFSAGLGFAPFQVLGLDVFGLLGDDSAGAGLQLSLTL